MAPCKLCGEPTLWSDALCTKCGVAQDRLLAKRLGVGSGAGVSAGAINTRISFALGWLAGFVAGLVGALALLPLLVQL